ncbi:MAG: SWIM zinc finger family protein [Oscillospiraceae bacterium]|jgi:hypothetical protein|nr:SWIM zinc finger family protein [Oscillospiraceae bacterium]
MRQITEQYVTSIAPNPAAVKNAKKISSSGGFVRLYASADDTFYMGECTGSGSSNYTTSADFADPAKPVYRCSCPSRQFPCKHSLALLFEMAAQKKFAPCEVPEDILQKRKKLEAKAEKATAKTEEADPAAPKAPPKVNKAARTKKLKKQLEGLDMTQELVNGLLNTGLGAMGGNSSSSYRDLAKQLGDYYLPGPQAYLNELVLEMEAFRKDADTVHYTRAAGILARLRALLTKSRAYLNGKLESGDVGDDGSELYEALGGVWKLDQLQALGLKKENAQIMQLAFNIYYDEARREYIDTGWWADLETGEVSVTCNYRPVKAVKYVKQDDTVFELARVPILTYYPGGLNRRIRWEAAEFVPVTGEHLAQLRAKAATELSGIVKAAKNELKNALSPDKIATLVRFRRIGKNEAGYVLEDPAGHTVLLDNMPGSEDTARRLSMLPDKNALENQVLLGAFYYDRARQRVCMQPYSIVTEQDVVRLMY